MGAKSLTPAASAPEQASETDWKAVSLSLKEKIDGLGQIMADNGLERPEEKTIIAFAGDMIAFLVISNRDLGAALGELRQSNDANFEHLGKLTAELDKIDAVLRAKDLDPAARPEGMSAVDQLLGLLGDLATANDQLAGRLGAATAKIETLEGKLEKAGKTPARGKKPRATVLALPIEPVKAIEAALTGPTSIVFSEDGGLIEDIKPIEFDPAAFREVNGRAMLARRIDIDRDVGFARIDHAWLLVEGKPVSRCEVPGGIRAGGGRGASFAADSLIFA